MNTKLLGFYPGEHVIIHRIRRFHSYSRPYRKEDMVKLIGKGRGSVLLGMLGLVLAALQAHAATTLLTVDVQNTSSLQWRSDIHGMFIDHPPELNDFPAAFNDLLVEYTPAAGSVSFDAIGQSKTFSIGSLAISGANIYDFIGFIGDGFDNVDVTVNDTSPFARFFNYDDPATFEVENLDLSASSINGGMGSAMGSTDGGTARGGTGPLDPNVSGAAFAILDAGAYEAYFDLGNGGYARVQYDILPIAFNNSQSSPINVRGTATLVDFQAPPAIPEPGLLFGFGGLAFLWIASRMRKSYYSANAA